MIRLSSQNIWYGRVRFWLCALTMAVLTACGGGGGGSSNSVESASPPAAAPVPTLTLGLKEVHLAWPTVSGATSYQLLESPDGTSQFMPVGGAIAETSVSHSIALYQRINAKYKVQACNSGGCTDSAVLALGGSLAEGVGYFKASNSRAHAMFGYSVALSADGTTLAVGAIDESSAATGINGDQTNTAAPNSGAVYVFTKTNGSWIQQAYLKASNTGAYDQFGFPIALSADGNTLAVGAFFEASAATGINGDESSNSATVSGAVYVFTRTGGTWSQQAYIKASNSEANDGFGSSVALSADGSTMAVGASREDGGTNGINGDQSNNSASGSGAVYVFTRTGGTWSQHAYIKASNGEANDGFGSSVALSADGNIMAVGATGEDSSATGVNSDQTSNGESSSGAVYIFTRTGSTWSQQSYIKASNTETMDKFGYSLALSDDGATLAVSARQEDSAATGINGDEFDNSASDSGAVYVFIRTGSIWSQQAYIKPSNTRTQWDFGYAISLSADGNTLAVSADREGSSASALNGAQDDNSLTSSGAVYVFVRDGAIWTQQAYVKATNPGPSNYFGQSVALSGDGKTLAVGAYTENSDATGIGGAQNNNNATHSGAVYLY
ncbi:FG-GAP repeat-containing protein [Noviherbaspirillum humi]|uniref:FG-GAP repeat-containing protein n=1 Tax=Noviherbaspirillum humi TaxID=1688639 RepID=A0A239KLV0_9BURK|nr:FG-GAP repeat protein [Noviherbaspirillum humi]SNT18970.1 FG-GAP repeat-containing protein [Noviherbaspirillum humi]